MFQYYKQTLSVSIQVTLHTHRRSRWLCFEKPARKLDVGLPLGTWITGQFSPFPDLKILAIPELCKLCGLLYLWEAEIL